MNVEDKLMDIAENKVPTLVNQIFGTVLQILLKPGAAATDPFFRKNLGERYLNIPLAIFSMIIWGAITVVAVLVSSSNEKRAISVVLGWLIVTGYFVLAALNHTAVRYRRFLGIRWHSRSRGESLFGSENFWRDVIIEVLVTVALCFASFTLGAFFLISRLQSYMQEELAAAQFYNRYLDTIDAEIESKQLEGALKNGFPASKTEGLYQPLPKSFQGQIRANVAKVVASNYINKPPVIHESIPPQPILSPSATTQILAEKASPRFKQFCGAVFATMKKKVTFFSQKKILKGLFIGITIVGAISGYFYFSGKANHRPAYPNYTQLHPPTATPDRTGQSLVASTTSPVDDRQNKSEQVASRVSQQSEAPINSTPGVKASAPGSVTGRIIEDKETGDAAAMIEMPEQTVIKVKDWTAGIGSRGEDDFTNALWHCGKELIPFMPILDNGMVVPEKMRNPFGAITAANPKFFIAISSHPELAEFQNEIQKCDKITTMTIALFSSKSGSVGTVLNYKVSNKENATLHKGFNALEDRLKKEGCQTLIDLMDGKRMSPEIRAALGSN